MKYSRSMAKKIMAAGIVIGVVSAAADRGRKNNMEYEVKRPEYTEAATEYQLEAYDGSTSTDISLKVNPKVYTQTQVEEHFDNVENNLEKLIMCGNASLDSVSGKLNLVTRVESEGIEIQWYSSDYTLVDYDGTVYNRGFYDGEEKSCVLTAQLCYRNYKRQVQLEVKVMAPKRNEEEKYKALVERLVSEAAKANEEDAVIYLPDSVNGKKITYSQVQEHTQPIIFPLLAAAAVGVLYVGSIFDERKREGLRQLQLKYDYSEVVSKLTLLVGAGMTFRKAWEKIVTDYKNNSINGKTRPVYDEMEITLNQLQTGVSELKAYEEFGRRCNTREYLKLASLLQQNLKKGSRGLADMLHEEAGLAFEQRKNLAVKRGEEAGTKLLAPMVLMLVVVMAIVMAPALMSFNM
ncbi:MAG: hypothetical protein Q4F11_05055 [Eubacteriales bacterium]|nr:hypothetical protein [Eubacteriales bacterium]